MIEFSGCLFFRLILLGVLFRLYSKKTHDASVDCHVTALNLFFYAACIDVSSALEHWFVLYFIEALYVAYSACLRAHDSSAIG